MGEVAIWNIDSIALRLSGKRASPQREGIEQWAIGEYRS